MWNFAHKRFVTGFNSDIECRRCTERDALFQKLPSSPAGPLEVCAARFVRKTVKMDRRRRRLNTSESDSDHSEDDERIQQKSSVRAPRSSECVSCAFSVPYSVWVMSFGVWSEWNVFHSCFRHFTQVSSHDPPVKVPRKSGQVICLHSVKT